LAHRPLGGFGTRHAVQTTAVQDASFQYDGAAKHSPDIGVEAGSNFEHEVAIGEFCRTSVQL